MIVVRDAEKVTAKKIKVGSIYKESFLTFIKGIYTLKNILIMIH